MISERWQQINTLLDAVLELSPSEQQAYLDLRCRDDPDLRREVLSLLEAYEHTHDFLDKPAKAYAAPLIPRANDSLTDQLIGKEIDGYHILGVLGRGGMGVVYKAEDQALGRTVALKVIAPRLARDEVFVKRFRREARAMAKFHHPNIVLAFALRQVDFDLYIAMEYVEGQTLADYLEEADGPLALPQALPLIKQFLSALEYAHERGVIHRDLKPRNIMLTEKREVKVMDFGLAKMLGKGSGETTVTNLRAGTLCYMSPEQARGLKDVDHRSDLFALGLTLYEMLAGRLPFDKDDSEFNILKTIVEKAFPSPHSFNPALPHQLGKIIMKALEKNPEKRYQSAGEMLAAIEAFQREEAVTITALPGLKAPTKRRKGWRYALLVAGLLLIVFGGSLFLFEGSTVGLQDAIVTPAPVSNEGDGGSENPDPGEAGDQAAALPLTSEHETENLSEDNPPATQETDDIIRTGVLVVDSTPQRAHIFVDGKPQGTTPTTIRNVPAGTHKIVLSLDGYASQTKSVVVEAEQTRSVDATLAPLMGELRVGARPWGKLYVGGELKVEELTIIQPLPLPAGRYTVVVEHPDYGKWRKVVDISPGQPQGFFANFEKLVKINITAQDTAGEFVEGKIYIDGIPRGDTPNSVEVRTGLHTIEVHAEGYVADGAPQEKNFEETSRLVIQLRKREQ